MLCYLADPANALPSILIMDVFFGPAQARLRMSLRAALYYSSLPLETVLLFAGLLNPPSG